MYRHHRITMFFDLATVFDYDIAETLARQTGWTNDEEKNTRENWLMWAAANNVGVHVEVSRDPDSPTGKQYLQFTQGEPTSEFSMRTFQIPLIMARDEFKLTLMKLCGYAEDRYNNDLMSYLVDCQVKHRENADRVVVTIPMWRTQCDNASDCGSDNETD